MEIQYIGMACALGLSAIGPLSARVTQRCLPLEPGKNVMRTANRHPL